MIASSPVSPQVLAYARWRVLNDTTPWLSSKLLSTHALHFGHLFDGLNAVVDRTPYCAKLVVELIPELFGRYFVERRLPASREADRARPYLLDQAGVRAQPPGHRLDGRRDSRGGAGEGAGRRWSWSAARRTATGPTTARSG